MRYYQLADRPDGRLIVETDSQSYDLTAIDPWLTSVRRLLNKAHTSEQSIDAYARQAIASAEPLSDADQQPERALPVRADEIWAAGVTYEISEQAREEESDMPDMYVEVYDADRPEIFFKATPSRTVGPNEAVGIRADSKWDVPEPELGIVLYEGSIVGYTIGNDMSSRSIEGENPLYLPQAKVYDRCCSIGPCLQTEIDDPRDLTMSMSIHRDGDCMYEDSTSTNKMVRSPDELVAAYVAHNAVPELAVLLTGTSLVPDDTFTLQPDDQIDISIEDIGTLSNFVVSV